MTFDITASC